MYIYLDIVFLQLSAPIQIECAKLLLVCPFTLKQGYWPALARAASERLAIHVARKDEQIHGFFATLKDGDTAIAYHIGFEREVAAQGHSALFTAAACRAGPSAGIRLPPCLIRPNRAGTQGPARLPTESMQVWVRHRQPMLNQVIRPLLGFIQHEEAPEFSPFKRNDSAQVVTDLA
ncbi:GNAT family N-acetyltransferase [Chitinimonas arctica]|uniref:GNAT family N-acetyltransferase n=1 Tax=Chitinimonas arctica TaxID=2594795 RepID=A0A516SCR2_9NEIS|nr:GNAT family N-acetyltransferase [Chitinimonas arctica]QDQ25943.1 GNAT family N-acetyltransferase [Chitinimonas arctica]